MYQFALRLTADKGKPELSQNCPRRLLSALYDIPPSPANLLIEVLYYTGYVEIDAGSL